MNYSYDYSYSSGDEEFLMLFLGIYGVVLGVVALFGIAMYVIRSLSVYTIAKRRGLDNPWLSWLPVGHEWILGCLSDQYKFVTQKKRQNRRKVLLGLGIASLICGVLMGGSVFSLIIMAALEQDVTGIGVSAVLLLLLYLAVIALAVVKMVFAYMCKYDVYKSCDPKNAVAYLVVSIFINVTEPFFLLVCRKKDLGMVPEESAAPGAAAPGAQAPVEEPAAETVPTEPAALTDGTPASLSAAAEEPAGEPAAPIILGASDVDEAGEEPSGE